MIPGHLSITLLKGKTSSIPKLQFPLPISKDWTTAGWIREMYFSEVKEDYWGNGKNLKSLTLSPLTAKHWKIYSTSAWRNQFESPHDSQMPYTLHWLSSALSMLFF